MIIIGIVLLSLGLLVSLIAFRGRVIQRGQFCRKCRFDLAGLDIEADGAKCPECGREIHHESARRSLIRSRSRVGLGVATILFLVGTAGIWAGATGKTGSIITAMPDPIVLWLTDLGVDEALDELVVRVSKVPNTMSAKSWDDAIERGLAFQADKVRVWDVRWGEVLFQGLALGQMSDEQLGQYFLDAYTIDLSVRDRVHPGDDGFGYRLDWELTRFKMLTGGATPYRFGPRVVAYGITGEDPIWEISPKRRGGLGEVWLYPYASGASSMWTKTREMKENLAQTPGNVVNVFIEYEITLLPLDDDQPVLAHRIHKEFAIKIIDPDKPIVSAYKDESAAQLVIDTIGISPLQIMSEIENPQPNQYLDILTSTLRSEVGLAPLSLDIFLLFEGQEIQVGTAAYNFTPGSFGAHIGWMLRPGDEQGLTLARAVHAKLIEDQSATIVVRTNPQLVDDVPGIDRVLDVKFMFEDVPVVIVETIEELQEPDWEASRIQAQPLHD